MGPKWVQNQFFELETWDSQQKSIFKIDERIWTQNCLKYTLRCPEKVQKGPKWVQNGSKKGPKSVFWARDLRFAPDVYFFDWWKDLDSKLPKVYCKVPKGVQKRVQKGSKNDKKPNFQLQTWDSYQKSIFMIDERIWNQNCLKCILMCTKMVQMSPKMVQKC